jgi:hypothetical protein
MLDNFGKYAIQSTVTGFYVTEKHRLMLKKIHAKLVQSIRLTRSLSTLRKVLMRLCFRQTNIKNIPRIPMECHNIRVLRTSFLRSRVKYRSEGSHTAFNNEIYIHGSPHPVLFSWCYDCISGLLAPISNGQQLITLHVGSNRI